MPCDPQTLKWRGHDLYVCEGCGVHTLDREAFERRCRSHTRASPEPTTTTGLYGPDDRPLPQPPAAESKPTSHDDLYAHDES